ncbi:helix-turn-helix domain-containing protein [Pedobacter immunditicola]|uniref:helix-turn-helix domain-containing protein n=1 Tax=Pedobacter immunditicola TaxID=3133440 RepID=UPI00309CFC3D
MKSPEKSPRPLTINFNQLDQISLEKDFEKEDYLIVIAGRVKGTYSIDFHEYVFQQNSIVMISKNQNVSFTFDGNEQQFIALTFTQDYLKNADENILKMLSFCIREHYEGKQILRMVDKDFEYLEKLSSQLLEIDKNLHSAIRWPSSFHFLQLILIYCANLYTKQSVDTIKGYTKVVGDFTTLLESNFRSTQKVHFYTEGLNLTYNSLARYTSSYCNKTPKAIITERLILEIKRLLAGTDTPIKEISYHLGFDEPTNLVKYFKKFTGSTPSQFRETSKNYHPL